MLLCLFGEPVSEIKNLSYIKVVFFSYKSQLFIQRKKIQLKYVTLKLVTYF